MKKVKESSTLDRSMLMRDIAKPLIFVALAIVGICIGLFTPLKHHLNIDSIRTFAETLGVWGPLTLLIIGALSPILFLPRWPVCFISGMLYGVLWGTVIGNCASLLGAWIHYITAKSLVADSSQKLLNKLNLDINRLRDMNSFWAIFILRAVPISNSAATNVLAGALKISTRSYLLASFLGMIPSTIMYAAWGKLMKKPSPEFYVVAVAVLAIMIIATLVVRRFISSNKDNS
ncbi:MAG: TVP38/TMEM64 family protein [Kiritimatiellae bacterium]|nr:TVP38/TMEM64 family protein [Kiritimatiellia bacterium]